MPVDGSRFAPGQDAHHPRQGSQPPRSAKRIYASRSGYNRRTSKRNLKKIAAYILVWTLFGLFNFSRDLTRRLYWHEPTPWVEILTSWMVGIYITAALTPAVLWIGSRIPISQAAWVRRAALHFLFSSIFSVAEIALETLVFLQLGVLRDVLKNSFATAFPLLLVAGFHENVITYWAVIGIQSGLRYYRRYQERELQASELEAQLARSQLYTLKMQLRPHFLFNTLNAIMSFVHERKGVQAEEMLARLSDLLRLSLEEVEAQEAPLRTELEYLRLYLSIEEVRFEDRLRVEVAAGPEVLDAAVPHMALQPIVENAVRHGIGKSLSAGRIGIRASRVDGALEIKVEDDGPGLQTASPEESRGIGLGNTRARLARLYGSAAQLTVRDGEHGGVVVTMLVPYRLIDDVLEPAQIQAHGTYSSDR